MVETFLDLARSDKLSFRSSKRRVVDAEDHRNCRLVDRDHRQRLWVVGRGNGVADVDIGNACQRHNLAYARLVGGNALQTFEQVKLFDSRLLNGAVVLGDGDLLIAGDLAGENSADSQPPYIFVVVHVGDQKLQ